MVIGENFGSLCYHHPVYHLLVILPIEYHTHVLDIIWICTLVCQLRGFFLFLEIGKTVCIYWESRSFDHLASIVWISKRDEIYFGKVSVLDVLFLFILLVHTVSQLVWHTLKIHPSIIMFNTWCTFFLLVLERIRWWFTCWSCHSIVVHLHRFFLLVNLEYLRIVSGCHEHWTLCSIAVCAVCGQLVKVILVWRTMKIIKVSKMG